VVDGREQPHDAVLVGQKKLATGDKPFYVWQNCALRSNSNAITLRVARAEKG
jgi:hypothetical protein